MKLLRGTPGLLGWLLLATVLVTAVAARDLAADYVLTGDQANLGLILAKRADPALFPRDYAYADIGWLRFYTPVYLRLVEWLIPRAGSYLGALLWLQAPVALLFLGGMFGLTHHLTGHRAAALATALAAMFHHDALGATFWGVAGLRLMMPRTLFLAGLPWLVWLWLRAVADRRWWLIPLVGLAGGLAANLHPVSGYFFGQLLLLLLLVGFGRRRPAVSQWGATALAAGLGALPITLNFITGRGDGPTPVDFAVFYRLMHRRFDTLFPFDHTALQRVLTPAGQTALVWFFLGGVLLLGLAYRRTRKPAGRRRAGRWWLALSLVQIPTGLVLTDGNVVVLWLAVLLYGLELGRPWPELEALFRRLRAWRLAPAPAPARVQPDRWDWFLLAWIGALNGLSFVASYFLDIVWRQSAWAGVTPLVAEQSRAARLVYLPLFLLSARLLARWLPPADTPRSRAIAFQALAVSALLATLAPPQALLGLALTTLWLVLRSRLRPSGRRATALVDLVLGVLLLGLALGPRFPLGLAAGLGLAGLMLAGRLEAPTGRRYAVGLAGLALLGLSLAVPGGGQLAVADVTGRQPGFLADLVAPDEEARALRRDYVAMSAWARQHTPAEALFYNDDAAFRLLSRRSITHGWNDLGLAYYQPDRFVTYARRWVQFQSGYRDVAVLRLNATGAAVDYLVLARPVALDPAAPLAYANDHYLIYDLRPHASGGG